MPEPETAARRPPESLPTNPVTFEPPVEPMETPTAVPEPMTRTEQGPPSRQEQDDDQPPLLSSHFG